MQTWTQESDFSNVFAYASALQQHLQTCVTPCLFLAGGKGSGEIVPCGLVTIQPFAPGGFRRLALNARSKLVRAAAAAFVRGTSASQGSLLVAAALEFGATILATSSWPIAGNFDVAPVVQWPSRQGLICGGWPCFQRAL